VQAVQPPGESHNQRSRAAFELPFGGCPARQILQDDAEAADELGSLLKVSQPTDSTSFDST